RLSESRAASPLPASGEREQKDPNMPLTSAYEGRPYSTGARTGMACWARLSGGQRFDTTAVRSADRFEWSRDAHGLPECMRLLWAAVWTFGSTAGLRRAPERTATSPAGGGRAPTPETGGAFVASLNLRHASAGMSAP